MHLLRLVLELAIIGWLPGAAIFRLRWLDRDRRAALSAEERGFWVVIISLGVSLAIVLALASLQRYSLSRLLIADVALAAVAAATARGRLRFGATAPRPTFAAIVPVGIVLIGVWRFFPSAEYVIGGKDPGVYLNEGVQIAQRGAVVLHDPVVAAVPPFARDLFFPSDERSIYPPLRFMGFWITNPGTGAVVGQFPHLFPASIAIGHGLAGLSGARSAVGVWTILGVLAVYFAAARLVGRAAAAATALLLVLHVIEVWFGRYPNAEVVMQTLLFAALLANARAHVDGDRFFAPVAGALLGLLLFLRYDAVLGIAGIAAGLGLGTVARGVGRGAPRWTFVAAFGCVAGLAALYLFGPMRPYMYLPIVFLSNLPRWEYLSLGLAFAGSLAAVALATRSRRLSAAVEAWVPTIIVLVVWLLAFYALVLRQPGGKLAAHDANALRMFTYWYLTLPALLAALIGFALVAHRSFWRDPALVVTVAVFACILFFKIRIVPEHFWMTRRFLPVILPGALLFASAAALSGARERSGPSVGRALIGIVFVVLLGVHYARASRPVVNHIEYAGLIPKIEALAGNLRDDDLLVVESRDTGSDVHVLALPLAYIYARPVLLLNSARPDKALFARFLEWAHTRYRRVLFMGGGGTDLLSSQYGVRPLASDRFQVPEYASLVDAYPDTVRQKEFEYGLYEFTAAEPPVSTFDLDVGVRDDLHVLRFYAKEESAGRTFRWTRARSFVSMTVIRPDSRDVTIWMNNGGRPGTVPPADVSVSLHGVALGTARVANGFAPYSFAIPPELAQRAAAYGEPVELVLSTTVWNPRQVIGTNDDRDLGVMVDRVAVR